MARPARRDRVFISYRRADSAGHAGRLNDDLTRRLGDRVFMDVADIAPGVDFENALRGALATCGAVLAVIGPRWLDAFASHGDGTDYVRLELAESLAQEGVAVVPVLIGGAALPAAELLPAELRGLAKRQAIALRDDRWQDDVAHLAGELRALLQLRRVPLPWLVAGAAAAIVGASTAWLALRAPPAPAAFSRERAQQVAAAAVAKASAACKPAPGEARSCPVLFRFAPDGRARDVYFDSGACPLKAPPFGDCMLERLGAVRIAPFDGVGDAEVEIELAVGADGSAQATPAQ